MVDGFIRYNADGTLLDLESEVARRAIAGTPPDLADRIAGPPPRLRQRVEDWIIALPNWALTTACIAWCATIWTAFGVTVYRLVFG